MDAEKASEKLILEYLKGILRKSKLWTPDSATVQSVVDDLEKIIMWPNVLKGKRPALLTQVCRRPLKGLK